MIRKSIFLKKLKSDPETLKQEQEYPLDFFNCHNDSFYLIFDLIVDEVTPFLDHI